MRIMKERKIMNKETLSKLKKIRPTLEGNFVMSLYSNPLEGFDDYPINPQKDLLTEDGKFYYNLGYNMVKKGIKIFDEISIATYLNDYPLLQQQFEKKGGYKAIQELSSMLEQENTEAYYNALTKNNAIIKLCESGFDVESNMDILNDYFFKFDNGIWYKYQFYQDIYGKVIRTYKDGKLATYIINFK